MFRFIVLIISALLFTACSKDKGSGHNYGYTPQDFCFVNGSYNCPNSNYYGNYAHPYGFNNFNNFPSCPTGTQPVAHPSAGLGCIPVGAWQSSNNLNYFSYQNFNFPMSCFSNSDCFGGICMPTNLQTNYVQVGVCRR